MPGCNTSSLLTLGSPQALGTATKKTPLASPSYCQSSCLPHPTRLAPHPSAGSNLSFRALHMQNRGVQAAQGIAEPPLTPTPAPAGPVSAPCSPTSRLSWGAAPLLAIPGGCRGLKGVTKGPPVCVPPYCPALHSTSAPSNSREVELKGVRGGPAQDGSR